MEEPRISYERLMAERRVEVAAQERRQKRLGYVRLAVVGVAAVLVWAALALQAFSIAWVLLPIAVFAALKPWRSCARVSICGRISPSSPKKRAPASIPSRLPSGANLLLCSTRARAPSSTAAPR